MQGHSVLLLEKDQFPRHQIGESLLPATTYGICSLLGIRDRIERAGFPRKQGGTFRWGKSPEPWTFRFAANPHVPGGYAYQVERAVFDKMLLDAAREKGVDVREQHVVLGVEQDGERFSRVRFRDDHGALRTATAKYIVDSEGHRGQNYALVGERVFSQFFQNVALFGYFLDGKRLPAPSEGNILCAAFRDGWFWYIPLSDRLTSVGAVVSREAAQRIQAGPEQAFRSYVESCPMIAEYLAPATRVTEGMYGEFRVRKDYSYCNARFWKPGLVLIGDAACFIDPVFSSGVHLARIEELTRDRPAGAEIDRISCGAIPAQDFIQRYAMASRPAVIVDAMPKLAASPWTSERIRAELGDTPVSVRTGDYVADIYRETMEAKELRLAEYLAAHGEGVADPGRATRPPYAASNGVPWAWHLWLDIPPFVPEGLCQYAKFWIGPAGTTTPLHRDWLDNFLTQLVGAKRIALVSPGSAPLLSARAVHAGLDSCNWVDPFDPQHPITAKCDPVFVTLNAGEMLFLPAGWFHDVRSTAFSFSVNFFLMRIPYAVCPPDWTTML